MLGAAEVQVARDEGLEERPGLARGVEHDGAGYLDLAHRQVPPVAGRAVSGSQRQRDP